jgi:hypothetical protein
VVPVTPCYPVPECAPLEPRPDPPCGGKEKYAFLTSTNEDFGFQSFMRTKAVPHISEQKSEEEGRHQFRSSSDSLFFCESSG